MKLLEVKKAGDQSKRVKTWKKNVTFTLSNEIFFYF